MSRGFVKEEDQEEIPMVAPRADLPNGVENYVTPAGLQALLDERKALEDNIGQLDRKNEKEHRIAVNHINMKLLMLNERISTCKLIDLDLQPQNEIRFGARVKLKIKANESLQTLQIVGVDEADISKAKVAFTSPLAKVLMAKKVGETAVLKLPTGERVFEILEIHYK